MRCPTDVAEVLTQLATYKGHLPTGSPLSPIMAYYAYYDVWERIAAVAVRHGWTLTVYVDDVTISGTHVRAKHLWEVKAAIHACGLRYHKEKSYFDRPPEVTGVIITAEGLQAPNRQLLRMRQTRRRMAMQPKNAQQGKALVGTLQGLRGQMKQIRSANN